MTGISDDQVMAAFERWKNLEDEKARISDDLKELFAEQKAFGHDTKAMRAAFRLKVKMDEASPEDADHEAKVDLYLAALNAPRASRAYARENVEEFDAETGEVFDTGSPRKAAEAVSERTAIQSLDNVPCDAVAERPALVGPQMGMAEDTIEGQPSVTVSLTVQHGGVNVGGPERAGVTAGETATYQPETAHETMGGTGDDCSFGNRGVWPPHDGASSSRGNDSLSVVTGGESAEMDRSTKSSFAARSGEAEKGRKAIPAGPEGVDLNHAGAGESPATPIAPASHGEAEAKSPETEEGDSNEVAHDHSHAATAGTRINHIVPATAPKTARDFRPHCLKPDACGASGLSHCYSCTKAMQKAEEFA